MCTVIQKHYQPFTHHITVKCPFVSHLVIMREITLRKNLNESENILEER